MIVGRGQVLHDRPGAGRSAHRPLEHVQAHLCVENRAADPLFDLSRIEKDRRLGLEELVIADSNSDGQTDGSRGVEHRLGYLPAVYAWYTAVPTTAATVMGITSMGFIVVPSFSSLSRSLAWS